MDLDDILEAVGKIFAVIGVALLVVLAFVQGKVALGFILLIVWMVVSGARLSW